MKKDQIIKLHKQVELCNPDLVAAWPGMGNVALGAVDYLRRMLNAKLFAEIDLSDIFSPEMIVINDGIAELPELPKNLFYYTQDPPVIFFESDVQLGGTGAMSILQNIIDFSMSYGSKRIFTGAAYSLPITHYSEPEIYGVGSSSDTRKYLSDFGVKPLAEGQISGMNGLILGYAAKKNMDAVSLLATMPLYAVNMPNPKASKAIVEKLCQLIPLRQVDMTEIEAAISEVDKKMDILAESIKEFFPGIPGSEQKQLGEIDLAENARIGEDKIPPHVHNRIEKLFLESIKDKKKAYLLKSELDRWNLYKTYEDRFLNLFRDKQ